jgi:long-subunit acyl-CoA synthetase (AMP-forming)
MARRSWRAAGAADGALAYALGELLVYGPLKNVLGLSSIRVAYTAGEAIGEDLFSFFRSLGINLKQLYGQTEAFLYVTVPEGRRGARRYGRAGRAECRHPHRRQRRGAVPLARHVRRLLQGSRRRPPR